MNAPGKTVAVLSRRAVLAGAAALTAMPARGQQGDRMFRLGVLWLNTLPDSPPHRALIDELGKHGFVEGRNLKIDAHFIAGRPEGLPEAQRGLIDGGPDVIFTGGDVGTRAVQVQTKTIPIVTVADDLVGSGLIDSLARPGGNTTGISILATELDSKRLELLVELLPGTTRFAVLADPTTSPAPLQVLEQSAYARGLTILVLRATDEDQIESAFAKARMAGVAGINVLASPIFNRLRHLIIKRAIQEGLPAVFHWPETAEDGGLLAYGPRITGVYRQAAGLVVKLFKGTAIANIPAEQPTRFELVINLKTAKAMGLTVPPFMLARADEVIE